MKLGMRVLASLAVGFLLGVSAGGASGLAAEAATDGWLRDARAYAERFGTSVEEGLRRLELQGRVGLLDELLEVEAEATFGGLWIEHEPDFRVVALFTEAEEGRGLLSEAALGDLAPLVEVRPARYTRAELRAQLEETDLRLQGAGARADLSVNTRKNRLEVLTTDPTALLSALAAKDGGLPEAALVVEVGSLFKPNMDLRGGRPVTRLNPFSGCTSGFAVQSSQGELGITTAGHCENNLLYQDEFSALTLRLEAYSGHHDVQWHRGTCHDTILNQIDDGIGIRGIARTVSRSAQAVGTFVCKHGRTTGRTCGTIDGKSVKPSYVPSGKGTFICVRNGGAVVSDDGDSGGPWHVGDQAYGVHSGGTDDLTQGIYMAVDYMSLRGFSVLRYRASMNPSGVMTCNGHSQNFYCYVSGRGGTPPYTYSNWSYYGPASSWSSNGSSASGSYGFPSCPSGSYNSISAQVTDSCGRVGYGSTYFFCP